MSTRAKTTGRKPRWTRGRLASVMRLTYGAGKRGGPDSRTAAAALGVSRRSVQRWLHGPDQQAAEIPSGRLQEFLRHVTPDEELLRDEEYAAAHARQAIKRVRGRRRLSPAWRSQHWLDPHLVAVLDLGDLGVRQVAVCRSAEQTVQELHRRGTVVDSTIVDSRFHAAVLAHELLRLVGPWRVLPPRSRVKQGPTQTWMPDAPKVGLEQLAVTHGLRRAPSPG